MSGPLRNNQGCWTCRLRKKKCDEGRPDCSTCKSLSITCYGFGPRPDWMDNGKNQKAIANSVKQIVKHTSRHKAPTTRYSKQPNPMIRIAPKSSNRSSSIEDSSSSAILDRQNGLDGPSEHRSSQDNRDSSSHENGDSLQDGAILSISADESVLLMHFLDNVFTLQYPMYKPGSLEGGRGWLLALLLRTKALYHAALTVSAYHRRVTILSKIRHPCRVKDLVEQERHLEICLAEFQQTMKSVNQTVQGVEGLCPKHGLGIVALIIQLIFFELLAGQGNIWQIHLRAATNMYHRGYEDKLVPFHLAEESTRILFQDLPLLEYGATVTEEVTAFRFLSGTMIWLDIMSSITAGTAPQLLPYHNTIIPPSSQTKLEDIMGCRNWVMLQIGRISSLHEHKTQSLQQGDSALIPFEQTVGDISREIQSGLAAEPSEDSDPPTLVTRIFAYTASIYLHVVTHGFQKLEVLDAIISKARRILQTQDSTHLLPALVAPLYIIGSVARQGDEEFFRHLFSSPPLLDPLLDHRGRILPILEEIWKRRQTTTSIGWGDTLDLTHDLLLL